MQQERWHRINDIFHSALDMEPGRRTTFLEQIGRDDSELRAEVERLLQHYREAENFLEEPAVELAAGAASPMDPGLPSFEGEMVLHYRVGAKIGQGGMGVVYEAADQKLGRRVALKFLRADFMQVGRATGDLLFEARAASSLNHPHICTIYAVEEYGGRPVLVMELLEGQTLQERIKAGPLGAAEVILLGTQACHVLAAAHDKGIVHGDIKPANLFLTREGRLKLLDFGVATWMRGGVPKRYGGGVAGTILYMSPEQLRGEPIDGRSDLFSLGVVLYELATRVRLFERGDPLMVMDAVLHYDGAVPSSVNPGLPTKLDSIIGRMTEKERERRPQSAADVARDLEQLGEWLGRRRRRRTRAGLAASAVLACAAGVFFLETQHRPILMDPILTDKDTIVLADFVNKTGEPVFQETLRHGVGLELQESPFLSVVSEERTQHVLRLMAKPAGTALTPEIAREVCQRTESAAVVDGSIASFGPRYVLLLRAENCHTGDVVFSEQAEAGREDVMRTMGQMARRFRERAGESLAMIAKHSTLLTEGTTPSLDAWKFYSEGGRVGMLGGHAAAIPFYRRAIAIDSEFASAYAYLGRDYTAIGEMELGRQYTRRAFQLRERANDQERFFIDYSYDRVVTGNLDKALETCELWRHMYPRDGRAQVFYGATAKVLGRYPLAMEAVTKAVELDPDLPYSYVHIISLHLYEGRLAEARDWLKRASQRKLGLPDFLMMRHLLAFLEGNQAEMEAADAEAEHESEIQDWVWGERAAVLAFSGRLKQARELSHRAVEVALEANRQESAAQHEAAAAVREALFGNVAEARARAMASLKLSRGKDAEYGAALAFALSGDSARAQAIMKDLERRYPEDTAVRFSFLPTLRAMLDVQQGHPRQAVEALSTSKRYDLGFLGCCSSGFVGSLYPIYARGEAYLAAHQGQEAAAEFQKILHYGGLAGSNPIGVLAYWRSGKALAMAGRQREQRRSTNDSCRSGGSPTPMSRFMDGSRRNMSAWLRKG